MTTTVAPDHAAAPPLPQAPYVIGSSAGRMHAVAWTAADAAIKTAPHQRHRLVITECDTEANLVTGWGAFTYTNRLLTRDSRCPTCGWAVALAQDTIPAELNAITPDPTELPALTRILDEPLIAVRLCEAILADNDLATYYDRDHEHIRDLLGHATAHAPTLIVPETCAEDDCDHRPDGQPLDTWRCPDAAAACPTCSVRAGMWAGAWEGQYATECTVPAPCSVLTALADHYGIRSPRQAANA
jgi:hypothetical protein